MMDIITNISEHLGIISTFLILLLGVIENSSKIAQKPLSAILKWLGFCRKIDELTEKLNRLEEKVDRNDIMVLKHRVLGVDLMIRSGEAHRISESQFHTAIEDLDKYQKYHEVYKDLNGELKNAEHNIWEAYNKIKRN